MPNFYVTRLGIVVPALAALGVVTAQNAWSEKLRPDRPLSCAIEVDRSAGSVELQAIVAGAGGNAGSYRLTVSKSGGGGSADIDQSGDFATGGSGSSVLSTVSLGGEGRYTARLSVTAGGRTVACTRRVGGTL